jgi:tRNA-dihydrouridine synthase
MRYYLAPMEGITTYIYRRAFNNNFGGVGKHGICKYFTPFIASKKMNKREINEILPEHNAGMNLVPQILTNRADEFLMVANKIAGYGYDTVNLNLGCPSGTVTARKRGAGFLSVPDELEVFLDEIYSKCPLKISIKTRIGVESEDEWDRLLGIYEKFPIAELIIHPRLQKEFYKFSPHKEAYLEAQKRLNIPLCYNGDITSIDSFNDVLAVIPDIEYMMIGRGILRNPALIGMLNNGADVSRLYSKDKFRAFHDEIFDGYAKTSDGGETPVLFKMKDLWTYLITSFVDSDKYLRQIRRADSFSEYKIAVGKLFRECELFTFQSVQ